MIYKFDHPKCSYHVYDVIKHLNIVKFKWFFEIILAYLIFIASLNHIFKNRIVKPMLCILQYYPSFFQVYLPKFDYICIIFSTISYKRNQIGYTLFFLHYKHQETIFLLTTWCQTEITTSWSRTKLIMAIVCVLSQLQIQQFQRYYGLVIDSYHNPTLLL